MAAFDVVNQPGRQFDRWRGHGSQSTRGAGGLGEGRPSIGPGCADALLWRLQRAGNRGDAGHYGTHGTTRLGEGAADPRGGTAIVNEPFAARAIGIGNNRSMTLSVAQMALMSRLLDEALPLDAVGRRAWLVRAAQEHPDLAAALREALLPGAAQAADLKALMSLPKLGDAE